MRCTRADWAFAMMRSFADGRKRRTQVVVGLWLAFYFSCGLVFGHEARRRDWSSQPAIVKLDTTEAVYALGDIHGDYKRLVKLLFACRVQSVAGKPNRRSGGLRAGLPVQFRERRPIFSLL
jgi:hypothetical protein